MMDATFIEQDCTIELEGRKFSSGGAWLCERADKPGTFVGVVYVHPRDNDAVQIGATGIRNRWPSADRGTVATWHGTHIADAAFGAWYQGNYCRMRAVSFVHNGINFSGRYCPDTSQAVRVTGRKRD